MPEFRVIKRTDVPHSSPVTERVLQPQVRLHKGGALYLSVLATEALSAQDCRVLAEFDVETRVLRFTVVDKLPWGFSEEECFPMRVRRNGGRGQRPGGVISLQALLRFIGFRKNGAQDLEIVDLDPGRHSISVVLPADQFAECGNSSH